MASPHILLKRAFERRRSINPEISLRALAKSSRVSPGFLSKVFSGQKGLPPSLANKLCEILRVDSLQRDQVMQGLQEALLKDKFGNTFKAKAATKKPLKSLEETILMPLQAEWLLSKWYYFVILDLITCDNFVNDPTWISKRIGLTKSETQEALSKLQHNGFVRELEDGKLEKIHNRLRFPTNFSKDNLRNFHALQMKRAILHMNSKTTQEDFDRRLITSITMAANPKTIKKVKSILHQAIYEASELLSGCNSTEVYQINLQFFPQTGE